MESKCGVVLKYRKRNGKAISLQMTGSNSTTKHIIHIKLKKLVNLKTKKKVEMNSTLINA